MTKRFQLSQAVKAHVLKGEINASGGLSGFHSEALLSIERGNVRLALSSDNQQRRASGQTYVAEATVQIGGKWVGPKRSSFFPHPSFRPRLGYYADQESSAFESWNEENLVRWIEQALTSHATIEAKNVANIQGHVRALGAGRSIPGANGWAYKAKGVTFYINAKSSSFSTLYPYAPGF